MMTPSPAKKINGSAQKYTTSDRKAMLTPSMSARKNGSARPAGSAG